VDYFLHGDSLLFVREVGNVTLNERIVVIKGKYHFLFRCNN